MQPPMHLLHTMAPLASLLATQISKTHRRRNGILQPRVWKQDDLVNRRQLWNRTTTQRNRKRNHRQTAIRRNLVCPSPMRRHHTQQRHPSKTSKVRAKLGIARSREFKPRHTGLLQQRHYTKRCKDSSKTATRKRNLRPRHGNHRQPKRNSTIHPTTPRIRQRPRPRLHHVRHPNTFPRHRNLCRSKKQRMDRRHQLEPLRHDSRHHADRNAIHPPDTRGTLWMLP